ncbi:unnamed protein product [Soboliphyme baturini]|uniref:Aldo_ket_red domain-containing protein n=1 Tax=Soboliphyme baturini TaxID=241478 RepID=A0A183I9K7_9BILA|nr:unnamed protein product [Soboliphyme baturini]
MWSNIDYTETWSALEHAVNNGKVNSIGVSNFNPDQIERLLKCSHAPSVNQVECHPYFSQKKLLEWCNEHDIIVTAYSPLSNPQRRMSESLQLNLLEDPVVKNIAAKHNKSAGQIVLRWGIQRGTVVIPKASSEKHLKENFDILNFSLTEDEMSSLEALNRGQRFVDLPQDAHHPHYPF